MLTRTIIAAGAAALLIPAAALAQTSEPDVVVTGPDETTRSVAVSIGDLDLRNDRAVKIADARVVRAAKKVCDYNGGYGLRQPTDYKLCYDKAFTNARVDLNSVIADVRAG